MNDIPTIANSAINKAPAYAIGFAIIVCSIFFGAAYFLNNTGLSKALERNLNAQTDATTAVNNMTKKVEELTQGVSSLAEGVKGSRESLAEVKTEINAIRVRVDNSDRIWGELTGRVIVIENKNKQ